AELGDAALELAQTCHRPGRVDSGEAVEPAWELFAVLGDPLVRDREGVLDPHVAGPDSHQKGALDPRSVHLGDVVRHRHAGPRVFRDAPLLVEVVVDADLLLGYFERGERVADDVDCTAHAFHPFSTTSRSLAPQDVSDSAVGWKWSGFVTHRMCLYISCPASSASLAAMAS